MKLRGVEIDTQAITAESAGEPYAFVGGFVDLAPHRATTVVVGWDVVVTAYDSPETVPDLDDGTQEYRTLLGGAIERTTRLVTQVYDRPGVADLCTLAATYESGGAAPAGFAAALRAWLIEQGADPAAFE